MHSLQNYGTTQSTYDGNAYSYSSTYHNGNLKVYAHHPMPPKADGGPSEYYMAQLRGIDMTHNVDSFRDAATAFRNARDLGKLHRDDFIERANQVARRQPAGCASTTSTRERSSLSVLQEDQSDTSADELALSRSARKRSRLAPAES
ncbi:hypothetical protein A1O1_05567 [Capronia coronata CBS 617.96]|uniref:Uncharacterized protein n=1 Tax=Capronia coronata CBS 617.96 TaxID=1182541 RepID=W9YH92_9EURO|nr:uncharacterized protein A1O1_05567 [Capronia coronata CBS 617.96]EXJ88636.1 hypothetical protein A1O1_05567 [Capronia coronata CBS 617.96]